MTFAWLPFLRSHNIEFVEHGPSVVRGHVAIHCPLCGAADPSHHMGLAVEGDKRGYWGCWRSASHRGKAPQRLIQALLGCSYAEASRIAGVRVALELGSDEGMGKFMTDMLSPQDETSPTPALAFPKEFRPVVNTGYGRMFLKYLRSRGYATEEALYLCKTYGLRFCVTGAFAYRLVIPVCMPDHGLVTWTGRSIQPDEKVRYKSLSQDKEKAAKQNLPPAPANIKNCLFNLEKLARTSADVLVVVEGPLDALRVDYYGRQYGVRATCLFSKSISQAQEDWLGTLTKRFTRKIVLVDKDAQTDAFGLFTRLERFGFTYELLTTVADPAEMSAKQIKRLTILA